MERLPASNNPYVIGSDDVVRIKFIYHFNKLVQAHAPNSQEQFGNCLIMAMKEVRSIDVNGVISCYSLAPDGNYTIHHGSMSLEETVWLVDSEDKTGWSKKVRGNTILTTSTNEGVVMKDLLKENRK